MVDATAEDVELEVFEEPPLVSVAGCSVPVEEVTLSALSSPQPMAARHTTLEITM